MKHKCPKCGSEMIEDESFKSGAIKMLFGTINEGINQETRFSCPNCNHVEYIKIKEEK